MTNGGSSLFILLGLILIMILLYVISITGIYRKAGVAGWKALIPIYNIYVLCQITEKSILYFVLSLIPIVNIFILMKLYMGLAKKFGKSDAFGIGICFLPFIFCPLLLLSKATYQKAEYHENSVTEQLGIPSIVSSPETIQGGIPEIGDVQPESKSISVGGMSFKGMEVAPMNEKLSEVSPITEVKTVQKENIQSEIVSPLNNQEVIPNPATENYMDPLSQGIPEILPTMESIPSQGISEVNHEEVFSAANMTTNSTFDSVNTNQNMVETQHPMEKPDLMASNTKIESIDMIKPDLMAPNTKIESDVIKPDLMAADPQFNQVSMAPKIESPLEPLGTFPNPMNPVSPNEVSGTKTIDGKEPISVPTFDPFGIHLSSKNENMNQDSQNPM